MTKLNTKISIVDYLKSIWQDSSFSARKKLAEELWIKNYRWSPKQNKQLLAWKIESSWWVNTIVPKENIVQKDNKIAEWIIPGINDWKYNPQGDKNKDLLNKNKPENPVFPQYNKFEISDKERKNIEATQKAYYDPYYKRERSRLTQDYNVDTQTLDRLIQYSQTDLANNLAKTNKTFAKSMSKASNVYWQRWLLGSWLQKQAVWDTTADLSKNIANREDYQKRKEEWYNTQKSNIKTKYNRGLTSINENQQAQTYFDTLKEIKNRQNEYNRQFGQSQENVNFNLTKPTNPTSTSYSWTDVNKKLLDSNYR